MFFCRILAILLTCSPITIYISDIYFPYSFLGMTLFFLTSILFQKYYFSTIDFLFWGFGILAIISNKPISYQFILHTFVIYQYFLLSTQYSSSLLLVGIVLHFVGVFVPIANTINMVLLSVVILMFYLSIRKSSTPQTGEIDLEEIYIPQELEETEDIEDEEIYIPQELEETEDIEDILDLTIEDNIIQEYEELEYVIPSQNDEHP